MSLCCTICPYCLSVLYIKVCISTPYSILTLPTPLSSLASTSLFSISVSLFLFCYMYFSFLLLDSAYKWQHTVFVFICLTYFTKHNTLYVHLHGCKWQSVILFILFLWLSNIPFHVYKGICIYSESHLVVSDSLWPHGLYSSLNSPGQNTGVGSLSLLQGIFPTHGLNPGLLHCMWILYQLSHREAQEYWSGYPIPSLADLPNPGIELGCPALQADSLPTSYQGNPMCIYHIFFIHSSVAINLGCFHILTVVNNAATNIELRIALFI